jgi:hypothetical protein
MHLGHSKYVNLRIKSSPLIYRSFDRQHETQKAVRLKRIILKDSQMRYFESEAVLIEGAYNGM